MKYIPCAMAIWLLLIAFVSSEHPADRGLRSLTMPMAAAAEQPNPSTWGQTASSEKRSQASTVTRGMKKEQVRELWGDPVAVRQIRTCFGMREEWVYRGDMQRYGREERTLLFDEDEVLEEIK